MKTLTVKDLMAQLAAFDPNAPVVVSADAEGNRYSPAVAAERGAFTDWQPRAKKSSAVPCVVLWPRD